MQVLHGESVLESLMSAVDRPIWLVVAALAVFDLVTAFFFFVKVFINLCLLLDFNLDSV